MHSSRSQENRTGALDGRRLPQSRRGRGRAERCQGAAQSGAENVQPTASPDPEFRLAQLARCADVARRTPPRGGVWEVKATWEMRTA